MQKQGSSLFKVASILLLIWGVIAVIVNGAQLAQYSSLLKMLGGGLLLGMILLLLSTVAMAIAGILGVVNGKKPEKGGLCMIIGIVALAMLLLGTILLLAGIGGSGVNWIFTIIGLALTALYIVGAMQLKKAPVAPPMNNYGFNPGGFDPNNPYNNQAPNTPNMPYSNYNVPPVNNGQNGQNDQQ